MKERRWKLVALLAAGVAIGVMMVGTPAGAHIGNSVSHLWNQHLRPKADKRYVNESELLSAVVNADGTIARGNGVTAVVTAGTGNYRVEFDRNVRQCAYVGTIGLSGASGTSAPGFITVVGDALSVNGVFVTTDDSAAASTNLGFHLVVDCARKTSPARVVAPRGGGGSDNQG